MLTSDHASLSLPVSPLSTHPSIVTQSTTTSDGTPTQTGSNRSSSTLTALQPFIAGAPGSAGGRIVLVLVLVTVVVVVIIRTISNDGARRTTRPTPE